MRKATKESYESEVSGAERRTSTQRSRLRDGVVGGEGGQGRGKEVSQAEGELKRTTEGKRRRSRRKKRRGTVSRGKRGGRLDWTG